MASQVALTAISLLLTFAGIAGRRLSGSSYSVLGRTSALPGGLYSGNRYSIYGNTGAQYLGGSSRTVKTTVDNHRWIGNGNNGLLTHGGSYIFLGRPSIDYSHTFFNGRSPSYISGLHGSGLTTNLRGSSVFSGYPYVTSAVDTSLLDGFSRRSGVTSTVGTFLSEGNARGRDILTLPGPSFSNSLNTGFILDAHNRGYSPATSKIVHTTNNHFIRSGLGHFPGHININLINTGDRYGLRRDALLSQRLRFREMMLARAQRQLLREQLALRAAAGSGFVVGSAGAGGAFLTGTTTTQTGVDDDDQFDYPLPAETPSQTASSY